MSLAPAALPPAVFIQKMDALNRQRSLEDHESIALEKAVVRGVVPLREAARLGLKRDKRVYLK